nr:rhodanese-like domain-containing protein [Edwardsiella ictaluri]
MRMLGADKDRMLVFYCGFVKCARSHNAAMWARTLGYRHVYRLPGGITAWKEAGYPVDKASSVTPVSADAAKGSSCTQGC